MTYFAPQARLIALATGQTVATTTQSDLVSVQVTQVNTGPSQLSITVNNWHSAGDPQVGSTTPFFPPWKYNDLVFFKPGQRIQVDFRYQGTNADTGWQTMIVARITGMTFGFPSGGGAQLQMQGEDLISLLKNSNESDKNYQNQKENDIARDLITRSQADLDLVDDNFPPTITQPLRSERHSKNTPYLTFLQGLADKIDCELWVDDGSYNFDDVSAAPAAYSGARAKLHFEKARSLTDPGSNTLLMKWGGADQATSANITDFTAKLQVADQFNKVKAGGSSPNNREQLNAEATLSAVQEDLHPSDAIPAPTVRSRFFAAEPGYQDATMTVDVSHMDQARANLKAAAELRKKARELLVVDGTAVGHLKLRAGIHVQVDGMRPPFDGIYYVTKAVHTLDGGGYKTQFTLRRPGITEPSGYLGRS